MVTPMFVAFNQFGPLNYPRTAVVPATAAKTIPFYIILCRAAFTQVPRELRDAALVDGNSNDRIALMNYAGIHVAPILLVFVLPRRRIGGGLTSDAPK